MIASEVVVGVDGGNSKTDVVLCDRHGGILAELRGPGTNANRQGVPATCSDVVELVAAARQKAGIGSGPLAAGAFHLANVDTPSTEEAVRDGLTTAGLAGRVMVGNDTFAVLRAGAPDGWGVAVVSGAGVNACGVAPDGRIARFLALGDLSGDWGGGMPIAVAAMGAAVRAGDGRGPATSLRQLIPQALGTATVEQAAIALVERRLASDVLHVLPPLVAAAATAGDKAAIGIIERQATEIVTMIRALLTRLDLMALPTPVILGGGTLQYGPELLHQRIRAELAAVAPLAQPRVLDIRPVAGPVLEALEIAGWLTAVAATRVRDGLTIVTSQVTA